MDYPRMYRVNQVFEASSIPDVAAHIRKEFSTLRLEEKVRPGQTVALTAGSRGIYGYVTILATLVECLRGLGLKPFILPAMGSHGGATAEGQEKMLNGLGVCESSMSAPIVSSMEVDSLGRTPSGAEVFFSRDAINADHLVVVNRVKAHTAFHSDVESGLCKMLAVGCGKHAGALNMHNLWIGGDDRSRRQKSSCKKSPSCLVWPLSRMPGRKPRRCDSLLPTALWKRTGNFW